MAVKKTRETPKVGTGIRKRGFTDDGVGKKKGKTDDGVVKKKVKTDNGVVKKKVKTDDGASTEQTKKPNHRGKPLKRIQDKPKPVILSSKEAHAKSKTLRNERRQKDRSHYDATIEMKKIWEDLRRQNLPKDQREQLCEKVMALVRGKERDFVFAHDTTRIFQTLSKYASRSIRSELFKSLQESILEMTKSTYSVFFVRSLLRRGTKEEKKIVLEKLMQNARKLIGHKIAGSVVEFAYNEYATAEQRLAFARQFYGPSFILFSTSQQSLAEVFAAKPEKKPSILRHMKESLEGIIEKETLKFTFVHNLLLDYFIHADDTDRQNMAESLQEHVAHIAHTREGARAAMYVVWYSSAKGRKLIIKQIKPFLEKLLVEEYGHMLLFAIFDAVDDTKFVGKLVLSEVKERLDTLVQNKWGRHVVQYLLSARDPQHVNKEIQQLLAQGDKNLFSKKDSEVRRKELREEISPAIISYAADNLDTFLSNNSLKVLLFCILKHAVGSKQHLVNAIVTRYNHPYSEKAKDHPLNDKTLRFTIRKLLENDADNVIVQSFVEGITPKVYSSYVKTDQGCYFVADLIKASQEDLKKSLIATVSKHRAAIAAKKDNKPQETLLTLIE